MVPFDEQVTNHQIAWRRNNIKSEEWGSRNGKQYEWILPHKLWEEGLWHNIRSGSRHSLRNYLDSNKIQKHIDANNLKSSWVLCANLYFPFGVSDAGRKLLADILRQYVDSTILSVECVELEYEEDKVGFLHPSSLLGEKDGRRGAGQTSPDIAFLVNDGKGLILTENKFVEHSFYSCSARTRIDKTGRAGNPDPSRCKNAVAVLDDYKVQCHQVVWGRKYWNHLAPVINRKMMSSLHACPAAHAGYQLFRQQALAEGIAAFDKYDLVVSCLAIDERNDELKECLRATGISDVRQWGNLFDGKAKFAVFTHQQWVDWVRTNNQDGLWSDWLNYIEARYGFCP